MLVVALLPVSHPGGLGSVRPFTLQQGRVIAIGRGCTNLGDPIDEGGRVGPRADHLVLRDVLRPVRIAQKPGQFVPFRQQSVEYCQIGGVAAVLELLVELPSRFSVTSIGHEWKVVGVARGDVDLTPLVWRVFVNPVLGKTVQLANRVEHHPASALVIARVPGELLPDPDNLVLQGRNPPPPLIALLDTGATEVTKPLFHEVPGRRVRPRRVDGLHTLVEPAIEVQLGQVFLNLPLTILSHFSHRLVRVDTGKEVALRKGRIEMHHHLVVGQERILDGPGPVDFGDPGAVGFGPGQVFFGCVAEFARRAVQRRSAEFPLGCGSRPGGAVECAARDTRESDHRQQPGNRFVHHGFLHFL